MNTFMILLATLAVAAWLAVFIVARRRQAGHDTTETDSRFYPGIAIDHASDGLLIMNMNGIILWVNPAYCRIMGYAADEMIGRNPLGFALLPEDTPDAEFLRNYRFVPEEFAASGLQLYKNIRKNGDIFWNQINVSFHTTPEGEEYAVLVCRDVTANIEKEQALEAATQELAYIAAHDDLTGAANRAELARFVEVALRKARQNGSNIGLLHIDLDHFKQINDTYGHSAGDAVLIATAQRLRAEIRDTDLVARIGGDEFVVVCTDLHRLDDLKKIGTGLIGAVNKPIPWQDGTLNCHISIGASLSHDGIRSADEMLIQSDFALYDVKRSGRGRVATYNRRLHERYTREAEMATELRNAVRDRTLDFHFQPVVGITPGDVRGFETLVRWHHPRDGLIPPADFLPIAQSLSLMAEIDFLAMNAAMDFKQRLNAAGHTALRMSFNTSPEVLAHPHFLRRLREGLGQRDLHPADIVVEVLETVVFGSQSIETPFVAAITALEKAGIVTVLDDFGSGHAGLAHLARLPIKGVKIDHSLTRNILTDPTTDKIIGTLIGLCNELGLRVCTEGVEEADQAARLADLGTSSIQGYWIARPMPADAALAWVDSNTDCSRLALPLTKGRRTA